jgi:hypothetical protein
MGWSASESVIRKARKTHILAEVLEVVLMVSSNQSLAATGGVVSATVRRKKNGKELTRQRADGVSTIGKPLPPCLVSDDTGRVINLADRP